MLKPVVGGW